MMRMIDAYLGIEGRQKLQRMLHVLGIVLAFRYFTAKTPRVGYRLTTVDNDEKYIQLLPSAQSYAIIQGFLTSGNVGLLSENTEGRR